MSLSMNLRFLCFFCFVQSTLLSEPISISPTPFSVAFTPNSILKNPPPGEIRYAGDKARYSTCTGVAWFSHNRYLAAVNLSTSSIQIYEFSKQLATLNPLLHFDKSPSLELARPENLSFSKDEKLLAIPNMRSGKVLVYQVTPDSFIRKAPSPPVAVLQHYQVHGARFSPDSKYLAIPSIFGKGSIHFHRINNKNNKITFNHTQTIEGLFEPLKPKSIDFSSDGEFVVIGFCVKLGNKPGATEAVLASYKFDKKLGTMNPVPISVVKGLYSTETITFYPDSSCILAVDQANDRITAHEFDIKTGKIGAMWVALKNPEAELSLPHGISVSSDGKFVAVSNYGDDKVTVYDVIREEK